MTANLIKGKGFRGALRYNLAKVSKNVAEVLDSTFARSTEHGIMKEVQMIRSLRPRLEKYFYHTSINFPPEENISSDLMKRIGNEYLQAAGFDQHQFIMFRHFDAGHPHLHILVNRIGYDGTLMSDSRDFQRTEDILRSLEIKHELRRVAPSRQAASRSATKNEIEMMKRTGEPSGRVKLQYLIGEALKGKPCLEEFVERLKRKGVSVILNKASTGYVSGISYRIGAFTSTGSKLGAAYKWHAVRMRLDETPAKKNSEMDSSFPPESNQGNIGLGDLTGAAPDGQIIKVSELLTDLLEPDRQAQFSDSVPVRKKKKRKKKRT